jgi:uncharacterized protein YbjT (DUF2867 family)
LILVTGATGELGRPLVEQLRTRGEEVRAMSRHGEVKADLATGEGLDAAVAGVATIVHAASSPVRNLRETDVDGTRRLVAAAEKAGVGHVVYVSIVGIERAQAYFYYRAKLQAEAIVAAGGVPWTIFRATQFHSLMPERLFPAMSPFGVLPIDPRWQMQPVEVTEVAARLAAVATAAPAGRLPDFGGPQVLTWLEMARAWKRAGGSRKIVLRLPIPGDFSREFRDGLICPEHRDGKVTYEEWLARRYKRA